MKAKEAILKPTDLRFDNWVNVKNGPLTVSVKVHSIYPSAIGTHLGTIMFGNVSPIPITPEILEKAGFVKIDGKDSIYDKGQMRLYLGLHGSLCYTEYEKGSYCYLRLIQYTHELQNLHYTLYNSELPINL